ncbi:MAG: hypothetical protein ACRCXX_14245 [Cetobacterium sp.]|uniref:hypothetical protein n=1 Tax=Cetobacterium sp. TaxID=2071632 RepID=UPI003F3EADB6
MIKINFNSDFDDFLLSIGNALNVNIDPSSLDVKMFKIFHDISSDIASSTEEKINSMFFENLKGEDLDIVMEFFDSHRTKGGESDIHSFTLYNKSNDSFLIEKGSLFNFEGYSFKVLKDTYVISGSSELLTQRYGVQSTIETPTFTNDGVLTFDLKNISSLSENYAQKFTNSLRLSAYNVNSDEVQSDFEFREKSKSIMQTLGHSNSQIIKSRILENSLVKNVVVEDNDGVTRMTVIPYSIQNIDDLINYSKEVVDYWKSDNVVVEKPNLIEIDIEGLISIIAADQNVSNLKELIVSAVIEYFSGGFSGTIYKHKVISLIQEILDSSSDYSDYDLSKVAIKYNFYSKGNYEVPVITSEIINNKKINENTIITFGILG